MADVLPSRDPLHVLPGAFAEWEALAAELPKLLAAGRVRRAIEGLPTRDVGVLHDEREQRRAMLLLSYFGHAYVWGEDPPVAVLPESLAVPWSAVAESLGRPPVLSYASYALDNWQRLDPTGPIALGNIVLVDHGRTIRGEPIHAVRQSFSIGLIRLHQPHQSRERHDVLQGAEHGRPGPQSHEDTEGLHFAQARSM